MVRFRWRWRGFVFPGDPVFDPETGGVGRCSSQTAPERFRAGLVVSLDGVGGYNWGPRWIRRGLDQAGVRSAIVIYDWTVGPAGMFLADLVAEERNRATALHLADWIAAYARAMPGRPVTLIGHSGGAAVAVWALEALPEDVRLRRAVLLAPALGPAYNLGPALRAGAAQKSGGEGFRAGCHGLLVKPCLDSEQHRLTSNRWHPDRRHFLVLHPFGPSRTAWLRPARGRTRACWPPRRPSSERWTAAIHRARASRAFGCPKTLRPTT